MSARPPVRSTSLRWRRGGHPHFHRADSVAPAPPRPAPTPPRRPPPCWSMACHLGLVLCRWSGFTGWPSGPRPSPPTGGDSDGGCRRRRGLPPRRCTRLLARAARRGLDGAEWKPAARVMAGVRLGGPHLTLGAAGWPVAGAGAGSRRGCLGSGPGVAGPIRTGAPAGLHRVAAGGDGMVGAGRRGMATRQFSLRAPRGYPDLASASPRASWRCAGWSRHARFGGGQGWPPTEERRRTEVMFEIGVWWNASGTGLRF